MSKPTPFYSDPKARVVLFHGDNVEVLQAMRENSIDTCVTDPPYLIAFDNGKKWDSIEGGREQYEWHLRWCREVYRVLKPGGYIAAFSATRTQHRLACAIEDAGFELRDMLMWLYGSGSPKGLNIAKGVDKANGHKESYGTRTFHHPGTERHSDEVNQRRIVNLQRSRVIHSEVAREWEGWNTALSPSWEPIILAMKPLDGGFAENALKWSVAGLHVDAARILDEKTEGIDPAQRAKGSIASPNGTRWPSNVIVSHHILCTDIACVPECAVVYLDRSTGRDSRVSRFYYAPKASQAERRAGTSGSEQSPHPTQKPLELMNWLCRLTETPTGGVVLDPFAGSGTTLIAAADCGRPTVGIELDPEFVAHAARRLQERA